MMLEGLFATIEGNFILGLLPDFLLVLCLLLSLFTGRVISENKSNIIQSYITTPLLGVGTIYCLYILCHISPSESYYYFSKTYILTFFTTLIKFLMYVIVLCLLVTNKKLKHEFNFLLFGATLGASCLVSSNDLIFFFVSLELLSLSTVAILAFDRQVSLSTESSLKYLLNSGVASGILVFALSLIYGVSLSADNSSGQIFEIVNTQFLIGSQVISFPFGVFYLAIALFAIAVAFKLSLFPFHNWFPDVLEGANTTVANFLITISKIAALAVFIRIIWTLFFSISIPFSEAHPLINESVLLPFSSPLGFLFLLVSLFAIFSMWMGNFLGIAHSQKDPKTFSLKRLMAFSSIAQTGYIISVVCLNPELGLKQAIFFLIIYNLFNLVIFLVLNHLDNNISESSRYNKTADNLESLRGLLYKQPGPGIALVVSLASLSGILPSMLIPKIFLATSLASSTLSSFTNEQVLQTSFSNPIITTLLLFSVLFSSVLGLFYYLKVIKTIVTPVKQVANIQTSYLPTWSTTLLTTVFLITSFSIALMPDLWMNNISNKAAQSILNVWNLTAQ